MTVWEKAKGSWYMVKGRVVEVGYGRVGVDNGKVSNKTPT